MPLTTDPALRSSHRYLLLAALSSRRYLAGTSFRTPPPWHKLGNSVNIETAPLAIRGQRCCNSRCTHPIENPSVGHIPLDSYYRPLWAVLKSPSHLSIVHSPNRRRFMIASSFWNLCTSPDRSKRGAYACSEFIRTIFARSVLQDPSQLLRVQYSNPTTMYHTNPGAMVTLASSLIMVWRLFMEKFCTCCFCF